MAATNNLPKEMLTKLADINAGKMAYDRDEITGIIRTILSSLEGDLMPGHMKVFTELEALSQYIHAAKQEIASLRPDEIMARHLPTATDELDAIVGATEQATNEILEAMEALDHNIGIMPPECAELVTACTTRVFEACNFQDITGQRITKVVKALKHIETKVAALMSAFGEELQKNQSAEAETQTSIDSDQALLNGPQLPDDAQKQRDIDALLADFD